MIAGIIGETYAGERRVAIIPATVPALAKLGIEVLVEPGAGAAAGFPDDQYQARGATIAGSRADVFERARLILNVRSLAAPGTVRTTRTIAVRTTIARTTKAKKMTRPETT